MFAALRASCPVSSLTRVAQDFTPRFEIMGELVVLDASGLSRLFGGPGEIGLYLHRALVPCASDARVAVGPTATAAMLLALGRAGLSVVTPNEVVTTLAELPLSVLRQYERAQHREARLDHERGTWSTEARSGQQASEGGWRHPRATHQASHVRRLPRLSEGASQRAKREAIDVQATLDLLDRWGITTLGALAALPMADVSERLGERGTRWQRLSRGQDERPLVPWVPDEPFDASIELEWPIEGLEPLSFVLTRLLEPLADRLERADRGAAIVHTQLRLVDKTVHTRHVPLPAPMRDPKTLRTLILLDLESHPPTAAVDRVGILIEPTPGRVLQWALFERAQPSPEQVSTLLARLIALMGDGHVGSPALVDSWRPGAFEVREFHVQAAGGQDALSPQHSAVIRRFRLPVPARVRVHEGRPVRVQVDRRGLASGPITQSAGPWRTSGAWWEPSATTARSAPSVSSAARSISASSVSSAAQVISAPSAPSVSSVSLASSVSSVPSALLATSASSASWDRDEWDVALGDGTVYRLFVERDIGQWFIEGVID